MTKNGPTANNEGMLRLLEWIAVELDASTDRRLWGPSIGLTSGLIVKPRRIDLSRVPIVVIEGDKTDVYTTVGQVAHVALKGRRRPAMVEVSSPRDLTASTQEPSTEPSRTVGQLAESMASEEGASDVTGM